MNIKSINDDDFKFVPRTFLEKSIVPLLVLNLLAMSVIVVLSRGPELKFALPLAAVIVVAWIMWSLYRVQRRTCAYDDYLAGFEAQELQRALDGAAAVDGDTVAAIKKRLRRR